MVNMDNEEPTEITSEDSKEIKAINKDAVHRICSGQVVISLAIAVKELVENAVDAGATIINIHFKEYGLELLEVSDNGSGVHKDYFQALTLKHYTSKIRRFEDLGELYTMGFRGEALSSLCALSDIEVTTKDPSVEVATKLRYDHSGNIISQEPAARQQGTTVSLKNLFTPLPVRRLQYTKNIKKEFAKMCKLLHAYCLLPTGIKYTCTNTLSKGTKSTIVTTEGHKTVRQNFISLYGVTQLATLVDVPLIPPNEKIMEDFSLKLNPEEELPFAMEFIISSGVHGSGRSSTDRQFFYINNRPCEHTKIFKLINELYRQFNNKQYPFFYMNITMKSSLIDVNITPDKRQVFLEQEKLILASIKSSMLEAFKDFPSTLRVQNHDISRNSVLNNMVPANRGLKRSFTDGGTSGTLNIMEMFKKRSRSEENNIGSANKCIREGEEIEYLAEIACKLSSEDDNILDLKHISKKNEDSKNNKQKLDVSDNIDCTKNLQSMPKSVDDLKEYTIQHVTIDSPVTNLTERRAVPLKMNLNTIKEHFKNKLKESQDDPNQNTLKFKSSINPGANKPAEEELTLCLSKENFSKMEIIGQFNKGFIITKLMQNLFIIDQHASDEKYNFEQLQLNTVFNSQKLVIPKLLQLTSDEKETLTEHEEVFKKNGFKFDHTNGNIYLTSIPISGNTVFGQKDIEEMIHMLQEDSSQAKACRPSRVRAMFASRACRKSVMVGDCLAPRDMRKIVDHMGEMDQPWNCPHGRPTIRHLLNLKQRKDKTDND